jgi:hypothetical protein
MKKIVSFLLILCSISTFAQNNNEKFIVVKFAPFKMIAVTPNLSLSVERRFSEAFSVQMQTDYIFDAVSFNNSSTTQDRNYRGFRIFPEVRKYYNTSTYTHPYVGIQAMYKYTRERFSDFRTEVDGAGQSFMRLKDFRTTKSVIASNAILGWLFFFNEDQRLSCDLNLGAGIRTKYIKSNVSASDFDRLVLLSANDSNLTFSATCNLKVGYTIFQ